MWGDVRRLTCTRAARERLEPHRQHEGAGIADVNAWIHRHAESNAVGPEGAGGSQSAALESRPDRHRWEDRLATSCLHRLHVGVQRAVVAVDARVLEGEARALALQQDVRLEGLARDRHLVRRQIGIGPGDRLAGLDGHAGGAEGERADAHGNAAGRRRHRRHHLHAPGHGRVGDDEVHGVMGLVALKARLVVGLVIEFAVGAEGRVLPSHRSGCRRRTPSPAARFSITCRR